jgi:hypothetical protein
MSGWIGVDLDGTLALYDGFEGPDIIGEPVPAMLERVKRWLADGKDVRIVTARVAIHCLKDELDYAMFMPAWEKWSQKHLGRVLPVTCQKDYQMVELWDDRCVQVEKNTGRVIGESTRGL